MFKFIVVDDEHLMRKGIVKKIYDIGLDLEFAGEADNGDSAIDLINRVNPHIILTDMRMPVVDGKLLLKTLQQNYPEKKVIVVSGYSDFEYMKEAISSNVVSYLLKPCNRAEIREAFEKAIALINKELTLKEKLDSVETEKEKTLYDMDLQTITDLILNSAKKSVLPVIRSNKMNAFIAEKKLVLLTVYCENQLILESCSKLYSESGTDEKGLYISRASSPNTGFVLLFFVDMGEDHILAQASDTAKIINSLSHQPNDKIFVGISGIKSSMVDLGKAYEESISALDSMPVSAGSGLYFFRKANASIQKSDWGNMDALLFFLESGNTDKVMELAENYFDYFEKQSMITLAEFKYNCQHLFERVREILLINFDNVTSNSLSTSYQTAIGACFDMNAIRLYFLQLLKNISTMLKEKNIYPSDELVNNMKTYIQRNYTKQITLEKISSLFFINPVYCSFLFKEKTGVNFVDYINNLRMERAKELLKSTDYKIYKIAKTLGYSNPKYFFRLFKKVTGQTPEEFRESC